MHYVLYTSIENLKKDLIDIISHLFYLIYTFNTRSYGSYWSSMCDFQTSDRRENHPSCCQPARFLSKSRLSFSHQGKHFHILKVCFFMCVCVCVCGYYPDLYFQYFSLLFFSLNIKKHSHNLLYIYRRNFWFLFVEYQWLKSIVWKICITIFMWSLKEKDMSSAYECKLLCKFLQLLNMITGILMAPRWVECFVNLSRKFCLWRFFYFFSFIVIVLQMDCLFVWFLNILVNNYAISRAGWKMEFCNQFMYFLGKSFKLPPCFNEHIYLW